MVRSVLVAAVCATAATALLAPQQRVRSHRPVRALDPSSPEMQAEFAVLKDASRGFMEKELELMGIPHKADMDDMEIKMRLMEARIVMSAPAAAGVAANASPYEKIIFEKPAIKSYVDRLYNKGDINGANIMMEYINDPKQATSRYGEIADYQKIFKKADELMAAPAFTSSKLAYSGFPMMGEDGLRGQMESVGAVVSFRVTEEDPVMGMTGNVEFEAEADAKTAVEKWDGADMGNEVTLSLKYL